jgi:sugar transferase (PEP-CTERM/EpsH1 system associated)
MNILFLSPRLPLPADTGGKIRTFNILKQIAKTNRVHMLCFSFDDADHTYIPEFEKLDIQVSMVPIGESTAFQKITGVLFNSLPFSISKYRTDAMRRAIEKVLKAQPFDAVHVDHLHMAHYTDCFKGIPCMLDEHNVEFKILERCRDVENSPVKKWLYDQQAWKMKLFESRKAKEFKGVFACSLDDQEILKVLTSGKVPLHVIANGVDTEYFNAGDTGSNPGPEEDAIVFTGSMDWLPNDDAITYFCNKILPLIWQKKEGVKFYVVGKNPSALVKDLARHDPRVIVTGRVDDVRPYIRRSKVFIVPLRIGGGTRLKILEAMSMSKAVVSTTIGAEGIECRDGQNILLGDGPQEFADKVLFLLKDHQKTLEIAAAARKFVCAQYDWDIIGQKLKNIYEKSTHA